MLISLSVMAVAAALASQAAVAYLRFFRGAGEIVAVRGQIGAVGTIAGAALWGVSPTLGEISFASDSAIEVLRSIGGAVACHGEPGRLVVPVPLESGNSLSAFEVQPEVGDLVAVFVRDSVASGWLRATVSAISAGGSCTTFQDAAAAMTLVLAEPLAVAAGAPVRLLRPIRLSHYRASDGQWYFGVRDWNGESQRFNTIQPVAGPLDAHSDNPATSGLTFRYFDSSASDLPSPPDVSRIALVSVTVRGRSRRPVSVAGRFRNSVFHADSAHTIVALRNAR